MGNASAEQTSLAPITAEALDDGELERIRAAAQRAAESFPPMTSEQVDLAARTLRDPAS